MHIYSWNALFNNSELDRAISFIEESDFDVFCLQEVSIPFLERLSQLPYYLVSAVDTNHPHPDQPQYLVTLSRHPIVHSVVFPLPDYWAKLPLRARLLTKALTHFRLSEVNGREALFTDIVLPSGTTRVFNLHLALGHPSVRRQEFEVAMALHDQDLPIIVCGDLNIFEAFFLNMLNWLLGGTLLDGILIHRERKQFEQRLAELSLANPLRGQTTHSGAFAQLDHILTSPHFEVTRARVIEDTTGSDHNPIHIELAPVADNTRSVERVLLDEEIISGRN